MMIPPLRPARIPRHLAGCLGVMLFVSCSHSTGLCDCPPARSAAVIYGRVTDAAGAPVQGAAVAAEFGYGGCGPHREIIGQASTGADGRYRAHLLVSLQPGTGDCLRAYAAPPAQSPLRGSDSVAFAVAFGTEEVVDSARVDLVLRAP
jgi:hypothetical protein